MDLRNGNNPSGAEHTNGDNMALQVRNGNVPSGATAAAATNGGSGGRYPRPFLTCYDTDSGVILIVAKRASIAASAEGPAVGMLSFSESYGGDVSGAYDPGMESDTDVDVDEILPFDGMLNLPATIQQPLEFVASHKAQHKTQLVSPRVPPKRETPPVAGTPPPSPSEGIRFQAVNDNVLERAVESITRPREEAVPFINLLPDNRFGYDKRTIPEMKERDSPPDVIPTPVTPVKMVSRVVEPPRSPPVFTNFLNNCRVREGQPAKFDVTVTGTPKPEIRWYRNGHQLNNSPETKIIIRLDGSSSLIIPKTLPKHSGTLTCKAENIAGLASCTAKLTVEGKDTLLYYFPLFDVKE